jgi:hypothetical protein
VQDLHAYLHGNFYEGLVNAGVPRDMIFAPKRWIDEPNLTSASVDWWQETQVDPVWLPSEYEMFGRATNSKNTHTATNQANFTGYYSSDTARKKINGDGLLSEYWTNAPYKDAPANPTPGNPSQAYTENSGNFVTIAKDGKSITVRALYVIGLAPAFCIK